MDVRAVYRWENPKTTGKWLALYTVLWYTEHIVSFVVSKQCHCLADSAKITTSGPISFTL